MRGIFVTGTDTNVGKTWVSAKIISALIKMGADVTPRKPVESGWNSPISETDAWQLASAAKKTNQLNLICPNRFIQATSPARAAQSENKELSIQQLHDQCLIQNTENSFLFIEGAGGFYSPIANDGLNSDLAISLQLPVLLIAENRLGCINQVLLSAKAIQNAKLPLAAVILNQSKNQNELDKSDLKENYEDISSLVNRPIFLINYIENDTSKFKEISELLLLFS